MKQKLKNIKKTVSENAPEIAIITVWSAAVVGAIYLGVKEQQARNEMITAAAQNGKSVIETPYGIIVI